MSIPDRLRSALAERYSIELELEAAAELKQHRATRTPVDEPARSKPKRLIQ